MKRRALLLLPCMVVLLFSGCNYTKPMMYVNLANRSGLPIRNVELTYPSGSFGLPELRDGQVHRHMVPMGSPCSFGIGFEYAEEKKYSQNYDLGAKCPTEIAFQVEPGMVVTRQTLRP